MLFSLLQIDCTVVVNQDNISFLIGLKTRGTLCKYGKQ